MGLVMISITIIISIFVQGNDTLMLCVGLIEFILFDVISYIYDKCSRKITETITFDFLQNFRLEDVVAEYYFNKKYSKPEMLHVFKDSGNLTNSFLKTLQNRIENSLTFNIAIWGESPAKFELAQTIAKLMQETIKTKRELNSRILFCIGENEVEERFQTLNKGDILIVSHLTEITRFAKISRTLLRANSNSFILTHDEKINLECLEFGLEVAGIDRKNRKVRALFYDQNYKRGELPMGRIILKLHDDDKLRSNWYEHKIKIINKFREHHNEIRQVSPKKEI